MGGVNKSEMEITGTCLSFFFSFRGFLSLTKHGLEGIISHFFVLAKCGKRWIFSLKKPFWRNSKSVARRIHPKRRFFSCYQKCPKDFLVPWKRLQFFSSSLFVVLCGVFFMQRKEKLDSIEPFLVSGRKAVLSAKSRFAWPRWNRNPWKMEF